MNPNYESRGQDPDPIGIRTGRNLSCDLAERLLGDRSQVRFRGYGSRLDRYWEDSAHGAALEQGSQGFVGCRSIRVGSMLSDQLDSAATDNQWFGCLGSRSIPSGSDVQAHTCHQPATLSHRIHKEGSPSLATPPPKSYGKNQVSLPRPSRRATFRAAHAG